MRRRPSQGRSAQSRRKRRSPVIPSSSRARRLTLSSPTTERCAARASRTAARSVRGESATTACSAPSGPTSKGARRTAIRCATSATTTSCGAGILYGWSKATRKICDVCDGATMTSERSASPARDYQTSIASAEDARPSYPRIEKQPVRRTGLWSAGKGIGQIADGADGLRPTIDSDLRIMPDS